MYEYLYKVSFKRSKYDNNLYVWKQGKNMVVLAMYVHDLIITGNNNDHILQVKKDLQAGFAGWI